MKQLLLFLVLFCIAPSAWATTYYVNKSGSDANSCTTAQSATDANAKLTITAGASCLSASDTLIVGNGTYTEALTNPLPSGSTSTTPTTMKCENQRQCTIQPGSGSDNGILLNAARNNIKIDGFVIDMQNRVTGSGTTIRTSTTIVFSNLIITNNELKNTRDDGLVIGDSTTGCTISGNYIHDLTINTDPSNLMYIRGSDCVIEHNHFKNAEYAMTVRSTTGSGGQRNIIRNNFFEHIGFNSADAGSRVINISSTVSSDANANSFYNNIFWDFNHKGITIATSYTKFYNNSMYDLGNGSTGIEVQSASSNSSLINNIVRVAGTAISNSGTSTTQTTNLTTGTVTDIWIDPATGNLSLKEASAAIDAGTVISGFSSGRYCGAGVDQGALEAPCRSSAVVENAAPTKYLVSYNLPSQSVRGGVGLQTPTVGNWAIRDDGAGMTESSAAIIGTSIVEITTSASLTAGVVDDAHTRSAAPSLMDNVAIGDYNGSLGTNFHNAFVRTHAATGGTNNIGGGGGVTFNVAHFRQISWYSSTATPTWKRLQDAVGGVQAGGRVALAVTIEGTGADPDSTPFEFYFNTGGGDSAITDSVASNAIAFANDAPTMQDQAAVSELLSGLTCPHVTFAVGAIVGKQTSQPNVNLSQDSCTTLIVLLQTKSDATGTINIKPKLPGGTAISYGVTPSITIRKPEAGH